MNIELLTDVDMMQFIERGVRGGVVFCAHRYAQANNKYMEEYLPVGNFSWIDNVEGFNVLDVDDESDVGYNLEVDLVYPHEIHDKHSDFPLCPQMMKSPTSDKAGPKKLMTTLHDKEHYVLHYHNLKQCLRYGLKCSKIHRILKFDQSPWMKPYIDLNTEKSIDLLPHGYTTNTFTF